MYTNDMNISNLINLLKEHNIRDIVISPGGTNMKFVKKVEDDPFFRCYSIVDERSAMYFALGIYLQTGNIVATSCTSAQATRNYIPGLTECYYKKAPILAITMEKHPRFTYQEYMQAPDQTSLPNDCVKKSFEVPFISDENDMIHSMRVINEAILELTHHGKGPVQLCIPALDSNTKFAQKDSYKITRYSQSDLKDCISKLKTKKIMIVIGEHRKFTNSLKKVINTFCEKYNCVIYANHLSNFQNEYTINGNLALTCMKEEEFNKIKPDIVITIGGQTGDYPLYNMLSKPSFANIEHWRVAENGDVVDTYDKLTSIFEMKEENFFEGITSENTNEPQGYYSQWKNIVDNMNNKIELPFSNTQIAQLLSPRIKEKSIIQFSILNSLRVWNLFELNDVECYSNVGAFGIDGGMSTLIGQSVITDKDCYMIIGDLAFLYDINSLSIRHIKNNVKILLINNNGGVEFKLYDGATNFDKINNYVAAGNHFKNAKGWAETCGFDYISASNTEEFKESLDYFVSKTSKPVLFEAFIKDEDEVKAYNSIIQHNSKMSFADYTKKGERFLKNSIKKIMNR